MPRNQREPKNAQARVAQQRSQNSRALRNYEAPKSRVDGEGKGNYGAIPALVGG